MSDYREVALGDLFALRNGRAKYTRQYVADHPGEYAVYSAGLNGAFGHVDDFDYDGLYLTWVMNGYGGRMQLIDGKFSANRDRGVLVPLSSVQVPDLTYLRFVAEPQLTAAAVGRRVDGRRNEYTKLYPETAGAVQILLPVTTGGGLDYQRMERVGARLRRIEAAQLRVRQARDPLERSTFAIRVDKPHATLRLSDNHLFRLSIGERVLRVDHVTSGIPVYSANVRVPFGSVAHSNLKSFDRPSLLWGIDGVFDWNLIPAHQAFATTDHCGRVELLSDDLDPEYLLHYLRSTRHEHGFDRVFRASLGNMKDRVELLVPQDATGALSLERQQALSASYRNKERARLACLASLDEVLAARLSADS